MAITTNQRITIYVIHLMKSYRVDVFVVCVYVCVCVVGDIKFHQ